MSFSIWQNQESGFNLCIKHILAIYTYSPHVLSERRENQIVVGLDADDLVAHHLMSRLLSSIEALCC